MEKEETFQGEVKEKRNIFSSIIVAGLGAFSAFYLFNPGAGVIELIPDNIPFIGNLDEAAAAGLLISCLAYFGVDLGGMFGRKDKKEDDGIIDVEVEDR
ncbi:MAG: DUF1232 domain-containing protein [Verrucomicrobiales bacterium]|nr:DUF1232 domain-containing protein [Verrucomicrobiales bacterium]